MSRGVPGVAGQEALWPNDEKADSRHKPKHLAATVTSPGSLIELAAEDVIVVDPMGPIERLAHDGTMLGQVVIDDNPRLRAVCVECEQPVSYVSHSVDGKAAHLRTQRQPGTSRGVSPGGCSTGESAEHHDMKLRIAAACRWALNRPGIVGSVRVEYRVTVNGRRSRQPDVSLLRPGRHEDVPWIAFEWQHKSTDTAEALALRTRDLQQAGFDEVVWLSTHETAEEHPYLQHAGLVGVPEQHRFRRLEIVGGSRSLDTSSRTGWKYDDLWLGPLIVKLCTTHRLVALTELEDGISRRTRTSATRIDDLTTALATTEVRAKQLLVQLNETAHQLNQRKAESEQMRLGFEAERTRTRDRRESDAKTIAQLLHRIKMASDAVVALEQAVSTSLVGVTNGWWRKSQQVNKTAELLRSQCRRVLGQLGVR